MCSGSNVFSLVGRITGLLGEAFLGGQDLSTQEQLLETGHRTECVSLGDIPWLLWG